MKPPVMRNRTRNKEDEQRKLSDEEASDDALTEDSDDSSSKNTKKSTYRYLHESITTESMLVTQSKRVDSIMDGTNRILLNSVVLILIVAVVIVFIWSLFGNPDQTSVQSEEPIVAFKKQLNETKMKFPNQMNKTWKVIGAAIKALVKMSTPTQPSVIMLATAKNGNGVVTCFIDRILETIKKAFPNSSGHIYIKGSEFKKDDTQEAKRKILNLLNNGFAKKKQLAIVDEIEDIPAKAFQVLHTFCDHENAPYKNVVILLVLRKELQSSMTDIDDDSNFDKLASDMLLKLWEGRQNFDTSIALLSRIANRVALIGPEKMEQLKSVCNVL